MRRLDHGHHVSSAADKRAVVSLVGRPCLLDNLSGPRQVHGALREVLAHEDLLGPAVHVSGRLVGLWALAVLGCVPSERILTATSGPLRLN